MSDNQMMANNDRANRTLLQLAEDYERECTVMNEITANRQALEAADQTAAFELSDKDIQMMEGYGQDKVVLQKIQRGIDLAQSSTTHMVVNGQTEINSLVPSVQEYAQLMVNLTGGFNEKVMDAIDKVDVVAFEDKTPAHIISRESAEQNVNAVLNNPTIKAEIAKLMPDAEKITVKDAINATVRLEDICVENGLSQHTNLDMVAIQVRTNVEDGRAYTLVRGKDERTKDEPVHLVEDDEGNVINTSAPITNDNIKAAELQGYKEDGTSNLISHQAEAPKETTTDPSRVTERTHLETVNEAGTLEQEGQDDVNQAIDDMRSVMASAENTVNKIKQLADGAEIENVTGANAGAVTQKIADRAASAAEEKAKQSKENENKGNGEAFVAGAAATVLTGNPLVGAGVGATVKAAQKSNSGHER